MGQSRENGTRQEISNLLRRREMTMAITDLIGSTTKMPCCARKLEKTKRLRRNAMSCRYSVLNTGAPSGIGAVSADCFVRRASHALTLARRTRIAFQLRSQPTERGQAHLKDAIRLEER